ncbi:hypothetical protein SAE02_18100 [Skermanella aerolata]|uniref:Uncharacterized protein n=1 Tax=Skermanella aerolata TaxID=393310 RepID=A0A512DMF7_9PROT|nr:hypothetical protein [Skermanella aerolata]GEO37662.1 hypothetical protein SAE02_18100 [Skermanella aerolata]
MSTNFTMQFDFTSSDEQAVLTNLQELNYSLVGYLGASGTGQITAGVPTWFTVPYTQVFGTETITYTPTYQVYTTSQSPIAQGTVINMQAVSPVTGLGQGFTFAQNGSWTYGMPAGTVVPANSVGLFNGTTQTLTVGLSAPAAFNASNSYTPFCAFTLPAQNTIFMTPNQSVMLVNAITNAVSGSVQSAIAAPGASFSFNSSAQYFLDVMAGTYGITNAPNTAPVTPVNSGASITQVVNS